MEETMSILGKVLMATYTICLPILLAWVHESRKERKSQQTFVVDSINTINTTVNNLINKIEMNEAMTSRYRIIRAADEIRNGGELSDDAVEQLAEDLDCYDRWVEKNAAWYKNHKGQNSRRIVIEYEERLSRRKDEK